MELIFVRHARAEISYPDEQRSLTSMGKKEFQRNCKLLKEKVNSVDLILSSPLTRAVETGDILNKEFKVGDLFYVESVLAPGCESNEIIDLAYIYNVNRMVCIFHLPDIAYNFALFCPNDSNNIFFNPGSIAVISFGNKVLEGKGKLKFFIP